jgi:hypothetical protein
MEVLSDLEAALHLTDDTAPSTTTSATSATTQASSVASNNSSSSVSSSSNLNSNTIVTQAIISSPSRSGAAASPFDGVPIPNSQIDDVSVIVKQPVSGGDGASSLLNNNNDVSAKDRTHVTAVVVGTPPI